MDCVRLTVTYLMPSGIAHIFATDGGCPDRYKFPMCTVAFCFPEALLSLGILYLRIQPITAPMKYFIQFTL